MSLESNSERNQANYEFQKRESLREYSSGTLLEKIYNVSNKTQDRELKEIIIEFIIENGLDVE